MTPEYQAALLEEYRGCDNQVTRMDNLIWQTASVVFPITLAGFAYFGSSTVHTPDQFAIVAAVAIGSMTLLVTWFLLSRAWYGYQSVAYFRLREIETELGLWHYRYSLFVRESPKNRRVAIEQIQDEEMKERFQRLENKIRTFPFSLTRPVGIRATTMVITLN